MPAFPDHQHDVRHVVLPSGKTIEVVYFDGLEIPAHAITTPPLAVELHVCECCSGRLVYPVEWEEAGADHWEVTRRCPDCEWIGSGVYTQESVERFDEWLDIGTEALVGDLKRLMHANLEDEIERFVVALAHDLIVPEDF